MSSTPSIWRWPAAIATGAATAVISGLVEGALSAPGGSGLAAGLLDAGLAAVPGLALGAIAAVGLYLILGADPLRALRDLADGWRSDAARAAGFTSRSAAIGLALIAWAAIAFHLTAHSLKTFHHMGLTALLLVALFAGSGLALWLIAAAVARVLATLLARFPHPALRALAPLSLLLVPVAVGLMIALSPVDGAGALGFLGLLRREELELGYLGLLALPALTAVIAFALAARRRARWIAPASLLVLLGSLALTVRAGLAFDGDPEAALAVEREAPLGRRILPLARGLFDRDRDGVSAAFGGGDCDDSDPGRWPGALDVPANGIDEDCSGEDAVAIASPAAAELGEPEPPAVAIPEGLSLVLITVDALRWDIGYMGYERPITPHIDRLADRGVVFERSYALSSYTGRSLAPIFIGRYPSEAHCNPAHFTKYYAENEMLAETLAAAGFATAGIGSHPYFNWGGLEQGFKRWKVIEGRGSGHPDRRTTSPAVADKAIEWIADQELTGGRFFLWVHFMDPHRDYLEHRGFSTFGHRPRDLYDGEVAFADHHIGRVLAALEEQGLAERTIVALTSDHGEAFREHDIAYHGRRLWEEIVRVPWVWAVPGMAPRRVKARVSQVDLAATVYELLKVDPPPQAGGRSLVPLMAADDDADRRIFLDQPLGPYIEEMYAVIDGGYKLIHSVNGNRYQLFDLGADPMERHDIARETPEQLERLQQIYQQVRGSLEISAERYRKP